ncbi:U-box domain-containing protein 4-like, partial [Planoprotostelium fungivorum]
MSAFGPLLNDLVSPDGLDRENALQYIINEAASPQFVMPCVNSGALNILMAMLRNEDESPYLQTCAVWALYFTHNIMLSDQVINPIIVILHNSYNMDLNIKCLSLITNLSTSEQNRAVLNQKGVSRLLAEMIKSNPDMVVHIARPLRNMLLDRGVVTLISILSNTFDEYIVREALSLLITLCVNSDLMRKIVVASGALTPLVYLLRSQRDPDILDLTLKVLITLSLSAENEIKLLNSGAIFPVIDILNVCYNQNNSLLEQATLLLSNITCNSEVQKSLRFCGLVQPLQDLLRSNDKGVQVQAARLITNLCLDEYNRSELLDAGTQQPLEALIAKSRDIESKSVFQAALSNLIIPVSDEVQNAIIDQFGSMSIDDMLSPMMSESPFSSAHSSPSPSPSVPVKPVQTSSAPSIIIGSGNQSFFNSR